MSSPAGIEAERVPARFNWPLINVLRPAGPPLLFGIRLWASVCLALYVAFWLQLDNAFWAGTSAAIVCQPQLGASLRKAWFRMIGTVIGAVTIVMLTAWFPQDRVMFLVGLALWAAACAFVGTALRNFAAYSAALAGYTAAIIAGDQLGAVGGLNGEAFMLAITRVSEICIGIVCAGVVLAGTDFGGAPRRLTVLLAELTADIARGFTGQLARAGQSIPDTQSVRRELIRRVIALDPIVDQALGESSRLRYHSPFLQEAVDGLFTALAGWRTVTVGLQRLPAEQSALEAATVLQYVPPELRAAFESRTPMGGMTAKPAYFGRMSDEVIHGLTVLSARTPARRLLADQAAKALRGISNALNGLALLVADPGRPLVGSGTIQLRVPDWLPAFVNAGRVFVTLSAVALFWIMTAWPGGASAITFAGISVVLLGLRSDQAYESAIGYLVGCCLAVVFAGILDFLVLPQMQTVVGFSLTLGLVLVPAGAMMAQPWRTAMFIPLVTNFLPILGPANQMTYDPEKFLNFALVIVASCGAGALSFRLMPPLSPAFRARRLLALTLRDLRGLATGPVPRTPESWESRMYGRLVAMPNDATPWQRARLVTALSVGVEIIELRRIAARLSTGTELGAALEAFAQGDSATASNQLGRLDEQLASAGPDGPVIVGVRARILAITEALTQHQAYFGAGQLA